MASARLHCIFVLLLYSQSSYGQSLGNNQNSGVNNGLCLQQQNLQRTPTRFNQAPNGVVNVNLSQQSNLPQANSQLPSTTSCQSLGNLQQQLNLPPNLQSQTLSGLPNNFQITKLGFTPVTPGMVDNPTISSQQSQNTGFNVLSNTGPQGGAQMAMSTLAELAALKGQQSLISLLNPQNNEQSQQNLQIVNSQNQLTDAQKQYLVRSLQGQNQQGINVMQAPPNMGNMDNQRAITVRAVTQPQGQAIVTPLGNQPAYITVQAQPLTTYFQNQTPQVVEEEPSILSLILSELGPQYAINSDFTPPKKGSKTNLKALIPLIIGLLKEKNNCGCRNCGCPNNCQSNGFSSNLMSEPPAAELFEGYSNFKNFNQDLDNLPPIVQKNDEGDSRIVNQPRKDDKKEIVNVDSEEVSEEDTSEYTEEDDE